jgi:hypothetical protein
MVIESLSLTFFRGNVHVSLVADVVFQATEVFKRTPFRRLNSLGNHTMATAAEKETVTPPSDVEKEVVTTEEPSGIGGKVATKLLKHSHDADAAMKAFEGFEGQTIELTEEASKRLLRKIDMHLMPVRRP